MLHGGLQTCIGAHHRGHIDAVCLLKDYSRNLQVGNAGISAAKSKAKASHRSCSLTDQLLQLQTVQKEQPTS
jgi:hypothetical protein